MTLFLSHAHREYFALPLVRPGLFALPFSRQPYPCLLWDHGGDWTPEERQSLVSALVTTDCRYAVCGGADCERWHDSIDREFIQTVPESLYDERFLMTSWHAEEPPLEVAWFFAWNTNFDDHDFSSFLVLELGAPTEPSLVVNSVARAVTDPEGAVDELENAV